MLRIDTIEPTTYGLEPLDAAVMMKKYVTLLGLINYGSAEQKAVARKEVLELDVIIHKHVNSSAFISAQRNLGLSEDEYECIQN
jgi:hypothetical protein